MWRLMCLVLCCVLVTSCDGGVSSDEERAAQSACERPVVVELGKVDTDTRVGEVVTSDVEVVELENGDSEVSGVVGLVDVDDSTQVSKRWGFVCTLTPDRSNGRFGLRVVSVSVQTS